MPKYIKVECNKAPTCTLPYGMCSHHNPHVHDKRCDWRYCGMTDRPIECKVRKIPCDGPSFPITFGVPEEHA